MRKFRLLIVCPEPTGLALLTSMLKTLGHEIEEAATDRQAVRYMERNPVNVVLACVDPGDPEALELLSYVRRKHPTVPVILMFPRLHPERAKEALRLGTMAVLKYPVPAAELRAAVTQALEKAQPLLVELPAASGLSGTTTPPVSGTSMPAELAAPYGSSGAARPLSVRGLSPLSQDQTYLPIPTMGEGETRLAAPVRAEVLEREVSLIAGDPSVRHIVELAGALALTRTPVLIVGEPGTGKSLLAHVLHLGGGNSERPFVTLSAQGYREGAGGTQGEETPRDSWLAAEWPVKLAQARGGAFHIEEVGDLPSEVQLQLLRELQLQEIESAAGHSRMHGRGEIRFIFSTSENLATLVEQGRFRQELYHRISAVTLMVPPLRVRGSDIELLAEHFREVFSRELRKHVAGFTRDALEALQRHEWPANVRELKGVIQRAVALCRGPRISSSDLAPILNAHRQVRSAGSGSSRAHSSTGIRPLKEALEEPEKRIIIQALQALNWNRQETARVLDINRTTLYKKMKKYNLLLDEPMWAN